MRYGFVIDQERCIGCHACTVACKEENRVPVGVFRTWVKYVEKGEFPNTTRHFGVLRCNHCDDAPCIEICPTATLFRREDGIVDFNNERCIGCKACMQACPYDALYIDPDTNTAAKCHYCAHRVEKNLEPACVVVCPTRAIIPGDLDNPSSQLSRVITAKKVSVRKPEKKTNPKLFYVAVDNDVITPTRLQQFETYFWSDRRHEDASTATGTSVDLGGRAREVYDAPHTIPWGWKIGVYLWTKSISGGVAVVAAAALGLFPQSLLPRTFAPAISLLMLGATLFLLVIDLKRPARFYYLFTKGNPRSWLVIGGYILTAFGVAIAAWLYFGLRGAAIPVAVRVAAFLLGLASAGYSAFLFSQAKGRDLWQSPLFLWHLLVHAVIAGAATLFLLNAVFGMEPTGMMEMLSRVLVVSLLLSFGVQLAEIALPHASEDFRIGLREITAGRFRWRYWGLALGAGIVLPAIIVGLFAFRSASVPRVVIASAAALALAGVWWFEDIWVKAGQVVPLS